PHRAGKGEAPSGPVGGSLASRVELRSFLEVRPWGFVLHFAAIGQRLIFFVKGTKQGRRFAALQPGQKRRKRIKGKGTATVHQQPRPIPTVRPEAEVARDVELAAERHFAAREQRNARLRGRRRGAA